MLKRNNRLKSRRDFKRTLAGQRLCANDCFALYGLPSLPSPAGSFDVSQPRVGFIVSKKIHKRAVRRNRIRRRLQELVRTSLLTERRQTLGRYRTLIFIARTGSLEASFQTLQQRVLQCFDKLSRA